ncbi:hypothetical protein F5X71_25255 [Nocardia brasiliensis]|uniref:ESX-1 secretion-associated protein EspA/EspE-like domain-containing protein n=1 Tax=Nocardia brasiliensis TaxID=37326 RepID=A0A6G9XW85_NOCBR|nr:WXG100 family type VII secretion target [Nocardia brasiliensis]QIS05179.1 hypothetical protein F5X71_25255 [Nocardia brasiliensis]
MTGPAAALRSPEAADPLPGWIPFFVAGDYIAPAYYIGQAVQSITGTDVFGLASEFVAGDWAGVEQAADAAGKLAGFDAAFHEALDTEGRHLLARTWHGSAADQARDHCHQLASTVERQCKARQEIARALHGIGNAMLDLARLLGDLLQDIVDRTIMWLVEMAAAATLSTTRDGGARAVAAAHAGLIFAGFEQILTVTTGACKTVVDLGATALALSSSRTDAPPSPGAATIASGA